MQKSSAPNSSFDTDAPGPAGAAEAGGTPVAGDADAVEKTTYVVGKGTDDRAERSPAAADPRVDRDDTDYDPPERRGTSGDVP